MTFTGMNYIAVAIAALGSFGFGAVWYTVLSRPWMRALGKTEAECRPQQSAAKYLPFAICILALLVMAWMLAGLMGHLNDVTIRGGIISGLFVWIGFVITTMGVNHAFSNAKPMLTVIDGLHWLFVLLIQGAVIGAFGV
jgi:hypothetical protein